jgi:uncharacterized membrane protein HdeD (DUF308 family)
LRLFAPTKQKPILMLISFFKNWWVQLLRGILLIAFGILAFINPGATAAALIFWLAIFILMDGLLSTYVAIRSWSENEEKWLHLLEGIVSILLGILLLRSPGAGMLTAVFFLGFWAIFAGVMRIAIAIQLRKQIESEWQLAISGALSIIFGILIISNPGAGVAGIMWIIGLAAVLIGILLIMVSLKLRKVAGRIGAAGDKLDDLKANLKERLDG